MQMPLWRMGQQLLERGLPVLQPSLSTALPKWASRAPPMDSSSMRRPLRPGRWLSLAQPHSRVKGVSMLAASSCIHSQRLTVQVCTCRDHYDWHCWHHHSSDSQCPS